MIEQQERRRSDSRVTDVGMPKGRLGWIQGENSMKIKNGATVKRVVEK